MYFVFPGFANMSRNLIYKGIFDFAVFQHLRWDMSMSFRREEVHFSKSRLRFASPLGGLVGGLTF